jgi:hypothetical protein
MMTLPKVLALGGLHRAHVLKEDRKRSLSMPKGVDWSSKKCPRLLVSDYFGNMEHPHLSWTTTFEQFKTSLKSIKKTWRLPTRLIHLQKDMRQRYFFYFHYINPTDF